MKYYLIHCCLKKVTEKYFADLLAKNIPLLPAS